MAVDTRRDQEGLAVMVPGLDHQVPGQAVLEMLPGALSKVANHEVSVRDMGSLEVQNHGPQGALQ